MSDLSSFAQNFSQAFAPYANQLLEESRARKKKKERSELIAQEYQTLLGPNADPDKIQAATNLGMEGMAVPMAMIQGPVPPPDMSDVLDPDLLPIYDKAPDELPRLISKQLVRNETRAQSEKNQQLYNNLRPQLEKVGFSESDWQTLQFLKEAGAPAEMINSMFMSKAPDQLERKLRGTRDIMTGKTGYDDYSPVDKAALEVLGVSDKALKAAYNIAGEKGNANEVMDALSKYSLQFMSMKIAGIWFDDENTPEQKTSEIQQIIKAANDFVEGKLLPAQQVALDKLKAVGGSREDLIELLESKPFQMKYNLTPDDVFFIKSQL